MGEFSIRRVSLKRVGANESAYNLLFRHVYRQLLEQLALRGDVAHAFYGDVAVEERDLLEGELVRVEEVVDEDVGNRPPVGKSERDRLERACPRACCGDYGLPQRRRADWWGADGDGEVGIYCEVS